MVNAKTNNSQKKIYVLDTSVLLSSPYAIFAFDEHVVWIPYNVITDLDAMRKTTNEASKNAQEALRIIEELRERGNLREVYLVHRPIDCKPGMLNLYGHVHRQGGIWSPYGFNICTDVNHFRLYSENDIRFLISQKAAWDNDADTKFLAGIE